MSIAMTSRDETHQRELDGARESYGRLADASEHLLSVLDDLLPALADSGLAIKHRQEVFAAANDVAAQISRPYNPVETAAMTPTPEEITRALVAEVASAVA